MEKIIQQLRNDFEEFRDYCFGIIIFGSHADYGNKVDLSEYFYFYRKLWKDMKHRIIDNQFKDIEERRNYRRKWMNEKEKILGKTGNLLRTSWSS
ncbi:MAG: hypothetical protein R6U44_06695 [Archaeoglobaceae archaeon]